jgi:tetratricopeptide (TPR) repeat protein
VAELVDRLRMLRAWSGMSYRTVHRELTRYRAGQGVPEVPVFNTVYRCFQPGRARVDWDLVVDIAKVLTGDDLAAQRWRHVCQLVSGETNAAAIVGVAGALPSDVAAFTGRAAELALIREHVRGDAAAVVAIAGMPGIGKTALAVHAGHALLAGGRCADVQLMVDLRGHDPDRPPADPAAVLSGFLRQLGVSGEQIQHLDLTERAAMFRTLTADRHALVLLDNAADAAQVTPLLPGGPGCVTLVTSRRAFAGLPGAHQLVLEVFDPGEAVALLHRAAGEHPGFDRGLGERIAEVVGYLPLGLTLVAAHIRGHPDWTLRDHLDRLVRHRDRLRLDTAVETAIRLSYEELPGEQRRLLRLLALHEGEDFDAYAAAALAGVRLADARHLLADLAAAQLLVSKGSGRFRFHDLIRTYCRARAEDDEPDTAWRASLTRLLDVYAYTASLAMDQLALADKNKRPRIPDPGLSRPPLTDLHLATEWLDAERHNLIAMAGFAAQRGWSAHADQLSATLARYLHNAGHYREAELLHTAALNTADPDAEARALNSLSRVYWRLGRLTEGIGRAARALEICRETGNRVGEADALGSLGLLCWQAGQYAEATEHNLRALHVAREIGDRSAEGAASNSLGLAYWRLGRYQEAVQHYRRALDIARESGHRAMQGPPLSNLAIIHWQLGDRSEAFDCAFEALEICRETGHRQGECLGLNNIGLMHRHSGQYQDAVDHHRQALEIAREIGNRPIEASAIGNLGTAYRGLGRYDEALDHHRQALLIARDTGDRPREAELLTDIGDTLRATGSLTEALTHYRQAETLAADIGDRNELARAHDGIAHSNRALGDDDTAREHWTEALAIYTDLGAPEATDIRGHLAEVDQPRA